MKPPVRLTAKNRPLVEDFLYDKVENYVFVAERVFGKNADDSIVLALLEDSSIESMLFISGNAVPISVSDQHAHQFVNTTYVKYAQIASIVGARDDVAIFWKALSNIDPSRRLASERPSQPYLLLDKHIESSLQSMIRYITLDDFDQYFDASHAMFVGEVGRAPYNLETYKERLRDQVLHKRSLGYFDDEGVLRFKVDVPIRYGDVCQVQGVWMHPEWRGHGRSAQHFSDALAIIQHDIAFRVTLYVNDFNLPALSLYRRLGFSQIEEYSTIFLDV
jgi:ribosomal protein S18 acetylase RimI-like enzyme